MWYPELALCITKMSGICFFFIIIKRVLRVVAVIGL